MPDYIKKWKDNAQFNLSQNDDIRFHVFAYSVVRCQKDFVQQIKYEQVFYRIVRLFECQ